ncbi:MAG: ComEC/Rec2 family competence protein, partial [Gemmiger sp.]
AGRKRRFYRPSICLNGLTVVFYMMLTGAPVSVVRAGSVFLLALLGDFLLHPADLLTSTGLVAVLMGLLNAYAPCDVGFQLSFCAVLGVQAASAVARWEEKRLPLPARLRPFLDTVQSSLLAALATTPVLVAHGLTVSGAGVLCNLLVVWMLQPALLLGILVLIFSLFVWMEPVFHLFSLLLAVWLNWMSGLVQWCAALPFASLCLPREFTLWVLAILAVLGLLFYAAKRLCWFAPAMLLCVVAAVWAGTVMNRDVVRIALVGTAGNPCAVITQNGSAAVVFRGGYKNLLAVQEYLAANGAPQWEAVVDLRDEPQPLDFPSVPTVLSLNELETSEQWMVLEGVSLDLTHEGNANLAVIGVGGYHFAMMNGNIRLAQPILVDVFFAAGSYPLSVQAKNILYTNRNPKWFEKTNGENLYYGGETPLIVVRPRRSLTFQGVTKIAVQ